MYEDSGKEEVTLPQNDRRTDRKCGTINVDYFTFKRMKFNKGSLTYLEKKKKKTPSNTNKKLLF